MTSSYICFFLVAVATLNLVVAFVVVSPSNTPFLQQQNSRKQSCLFVVADPPQEKYKEKKHNNVDRVVHDNDFIPTRLVTSLTNKVRKQSCGAYEVKPLEVSTIHEYKDVVVDEKDKIVAVRFYAKWCKSCKAIEGPFRRLMREYPNVKFVETPVTKENAFLHEGLGVPSFPYGHIYHPDVGLVEELKINKHEFQDFTRILNYYVDGEGDVEYPDNDVCTPVGKKKKEN